MLFSKTQEYALQALIRLAGAPAEFQLNRDLAAHLNLPAPYLAKVLKRLTQLGFLESAKGRGGGFRVSPGALSTTVAEIVVAVDGTPLDGCLLGLSKCTDQAACPLHERWMGVRGKLMSTLNQRSLGQLATAARSGRSKLAPARPHRSAVRKLSALPAKPARR